MINNNENWLVFVDTYILLDFYRIGGESAGRQLMALERHKDSLIMSEQIWMEFLKNRQKVILEGLNQMKKPEAPTNVPPILTDYQPRKMLGRNIKSAQSNYSKIISRAEKILSNPTGLDPVYKAVKKVFDHDSALNLKRPNKVRFSIRNKARKRFALGYPPRKKNDTSIGDAYNWEWVIQCALDSNDNHNILIVSRDGDFGIKYKETYYLNDWLNREFKDRVSRKRKIKLTGKLSDALRLLDEKVIPEDEEQEDRLIKLSLNDDTSQQVFNQDIIVTEKDVRELLEIFMSGSKKNPH